MSRLPSNRLLPRRVPRFPCSAAPNRKGTHLDVWTHRIVVSCLGLVVLLTGTSITALAMMGKEIPPALPALGSAAVGALSGMLAAVMRQVVLCDCLPQMRHFLRRI